MSAIISADIHLTDKARDKDRWNLFPWLKQQALKNGASTIALLGDLTDAKDRHASVLVNPLVEALDALAREGFLVIWLMGNHDCFDYGHPYFKFVNRLREYKTGVVRFISEPTSVQLWPGEGGHAMCLPCTKTPEQDWEGKDWSRYDYILTHQTYEGCLSENGTKMSGISRSLFSGFKGKIFSGDIHRPQIVSEKPYIEYVGSPYRVHFGDEFNPRVLMIGRTAKGAHQQQDLVYNGVHKFLLEIKEPEGVGEVRDMLERHARVFGEKIYEHDQVKIRIHLKRTDYDFWPDMRAAVREIAKAKGWELYGPELKAVAADPQRSDPDAPKVSLREIISNPKDIVKTYAKRHKLHKDLVDVGMSLL